MKNSLSLKFPTEQQKYYNQITGNFLKNDLQKRPEKIFSVIFYKRTWNHNCTKFHGSTVTLKFFIFVLHFSGTLPKVRPIKGMGPPWKKIVVSFCELAYKTLSQELHQNCPQLKIEYFSGDVITSTDRVRSCGLADFVRRFTGGLARCGFEPQYYVNSEFLTQPHQAVFSSSSFKGYQKIKRIATKYGHRNFKTAFSSVIGWISWAHSLFFILL